MSKLYNVGDKVYAKLPGTSDEYEAYIHDVLPKKYKILFEEGSIYSVMHANVRPFPSLSKNSNSTEMPSMRSRLRKSPSRAVNPLRTAKSPGRISSVISGDDSDMETIISRRVGRRRKSPARFGVNPVTSPRATKSPSRKGKIVKANKESESEVNKQENKDNAPKVHAEKSPRIIKSSSLLPESSVRISTKSTVSKGKNIDDALFKNEEKTYSLLSKIGIRRTIHSGVQENSTKEQTPVEFKEIIQTFTPVVELERLNELSDNEEQGQQKSNELNHEFTSRLRELPQEFGGWFGALILSITVPLALMLFTYTCSKTSCEMKIPNLIKLRKIDFYYSYEAVLMYISLTWITAILSLLNIFGTRQFGLPDKNGILKYYFNGVFSMSLICAIITLTSVYLVPVYKMAYEQYYQLLIASLSFAFITAVFLFVRSFYVSFTLLNPSGCTNNIIRDFWMGREVNPRVFGLLDLKIILNRLSVILMIILQTIFIYKSLDVTLTFPLSIDGMYEALIKANYNPTLLTVTLLTVFFGLDQLWFERQLVTTFEVQHEGMGLMTCLKYASSPFLYAAIPKFIFEHNVKLSWWVQAISVLTFIVGYWLYRVSNTEKHEFRSADRFSQFAYEDSLPTYAGRKLLIRRTWGWVRHPNYLGHLIILLGLAFPVLLTGRVLPLVPTLLVMLHIVHRTTRDNARCQRKYGSCWNQYCQIVQYRLVPGVF